MITSEDLRHRSVPAHALGRLASDLHAVSFDYLEPARSHQESDRRIEEVERICAAARAVVRGVSNRSRS